MHNYSKTEYLNFLNNLCEESCSDSECILKSFLVRMQPDVRMLLQLKCLQYFAKDQKESLSREELMKIWVNEGFAGKFCEVYTKTMKNKKVDEIDINELYLTIKKGVNSEH